MVRQLDNLGLDVEITSKSLGTNQVMSDQLRDMGVTLRPDSHEYVGSFVTHIYASPMLRDAAFIHHHSFKQKPNESLVSSAVSALAVHLMQVLFGRDKPATRDPRDKR